MLVFAHGDILGVSHMRDFSLTSSICWYLFDTISWHYFAILSTEHTYLGLNILHTVQHYFGTSLALHQCYLCGITWTILCHFVNTILALHYSNNAISIFKYYMITSYILFPKYFCTIFAPPPQYFVATQTIRWHFFDTTLWTTLLQTLFLIYNELIPFQNAFKLHSLFMYWSTTLIVEKYSDFII